MDAEVVVSVVEIKVIVVDLLDDVGVVEREELAKVD